MDEMREIIEEFLDETGELLDSVMSDVMDLETNGVVDPLIVPVQVKSPVVPLIVHPVDADPPIKFIVPDAPAIPKFTVVAAPNPFTVVAPVLTRLNVPAVVVKSPPFTAKSLFRVKLPAVENVAIVVPFVSISRLKLSFVPSTAVAPNELPNCSKKSPVAPPTIVPVQVRSPVVPLIVQPVDAAPPIKFIVPDAPATPKLTVVAAPNPFTVVAFVFTKLNVAADVVRSPPFTAKSLFNVKSPAVDNVA